ncbi:MerR family transcriptional regulator, partial [Faecalibaculum rodentium]|uniref:MerR family transcriptional regulator n=1 Tax=Faecalibaculum rodentium TaxID=1702221 RepID=UPI002731079A
MRTGEIAKVANVSEKTIRYYDRIGLLKPSKIEKNHYRTYSEYDLFKLQKILFFKQLGFSLDEIRTLVLKEEGLLESLNSQKELLTQKIETLTVQKDILTNLCKQAKKGSIHWRDVESLLSLT